MHHEKVKKQKKIGFLAKLFLFPFFIMPRTAKEVFVWCLVCVWYYLVRHRLKGVKKRISQAFPGYTPSQVKSIALKSLYNSLMSFVELSYIAFSSKKVFQYTKVLNIENYLKEVKKEKAVFLLTGHLGNGEIILSRISLEGHRLKLIGKRIGNKFLDQALFSLREASGLEHIPPKGALKELLKSIKKKETLVFVNDQFTSASAGGIEVDFFGLKTMTNAAPARLALKTSAVVIPVNIYRKGAKTIVDFEEAIQTERPYLSEAQNVVHMTQIYSDWLERTIKKRPEQWMWIHRRWKNLNFKKKKN